MASESPYYGKTWRHFLAISLANVCCDFNSNQLRRCEFWQSEIIFRLWYNIYIVSYHIVHTCTYIHIVPIFVCRLRTIVLSLQTKIGTICMYVHVCTIWYDTIYILYHSRKIISDCQNSHLRNWLELKSQQTLANEMARKWRHVFP